MSTEVSDERLRQAVREVLAEELDDDAPTATRRQVLGSIAAGGILGGVAGAGSAAGAASTVNGTPASLGTVASNVYKWADPGGLSGPYGSRNNVSSFDTGRIHIGSDTGTWSYDNGSQWQTLPIAKNHIKFSNGRVYGGRFTGSNDAQVVIDAIADRPDGEGVILQNPGFALDWEQQVDLPADEQGFSLDTQGVPKATIPSGFSGSRMIFKPGSTAAIDDLTGYRVGGFIIDDSANNALSWGIELRDVKEAYVDRSVIEDAPGVRLYGENNTTNQCEVHGPYLRSTRGPGVHLTGAGSGSVDGNLADQNWVYSPLFNDKNNNTETAFIDEGNGNTWIAPRVEFANIGFELRNARNYYILSGQWDRDYKWAIKEEGDARGEIVGLRTSNGTFESMRLVSPATQIEGRADHYLRTGRTGEPADLLDSLLPLTGNKSLAGAGFSASSSDGNGTVTTNKIFANTPMVELTTDGSATGDSVTLSTGDFVKSNAAPKLAWAFGPASSSDADNVTVRVGFYSGDSNRAELVYDPTDALGGSTGFGASYGTAEWYWDVATGGTLRASTATGVDPETVRTEATAQEAQALAINLEDRTDGRHWVAIINNNDADEGALAETGDNGAGIGQAALRIKVTTRTAAAKTWRLRPIHGARCYVAT